MTKKHVFFLQIIVFMFLYLLLLPQSVSAMSGGNCNKRNHQRDYYNNRKQLRDARDSQEDHCKCCGKIAYDVGIQQNSLINKNISCIEDVFNELLQNPQAVITACKNREIYPDLAELLIKLGNNKLLQNPESLIVACKNCEIYPGLAELLINAGMDVNVQEDFSKMTALHYAIKSKKTDLIYLLLQKGSLVNLSDKEGSSPLHYASLEGTPKIIELLIAAGANVNIRKNNNDTPLLIAAFMNFRTENAIKLVQLGADVTLKNNHGYTALHWAAKKNKAQLVMLLMEKNANPSAQIVSGAYKYIGYTPLHFAAVNCSTNICSLLLAKLCCFKNAHEAHSENNSPANTLQEHIISQLLYDKAYDLTTILEQSKHTIDSISHAISQSLLENVKYLINSEQQKKFIYDIRNQLIGSVYRNKLLELAKKLILIRNIKKKTALDMVGACYNNKDKSEKTDFLRKLLDNIVNAKSYDDIPDEIKCISEKYIQKILT